MALKLPLEEFYAQLPRKRVGSIVLLKNKEGHYLAGKPVYRDDGWLCPGGYVEANESPRSAALRELKEEYGIVPTTLTLRAVAYFKDDLPKGDSLHFVYSSMLPPAYSFKDIENLDGELSECGWFTTKELLSRLNPKQAAECEVVLHSKDDRILMLNNGMIESLDVS